jgi:hypothetical protein
MEAASVGGLFFAILNYRRDVACWNFVSFAAWLSGAQTVALASIGKTAAIQINWLLTPGFDFWIWRNSCWHLYIPFPFIISLRRRLLNG